VRWPEPIRELNVQKIIATLAQKYPDLRHVKMQQGKNRGVPDIIGIVFSEEVQQGSYADAWIFLYRKGGANGVLRGSRAGRDDLAGRSPELRPLRAKRVAVIGLGSLGANSAIELARSGLGELRMADFDFVEAGTVSRWPLGLTAAGKNKIDVIEEFLRANYPHTNVIAYPAMIGSAFPRQGYRDATEFEKLLDVDLIYDATAEVGIQHLLSDFAFEYGIPYICISATPGAWGGMVARIWPGHTRGCWMCLQQAINAKEIPVPATHDSGHVQVTGCASPTFTGAGFDLAMVGLSGVRLAVSTLCDGVADGYPDVEWDLAIVDFREADGQLIIPRWQTFTIERHRDCMNGITHPHCLDFANVA
jgi:molybdopterin/thiamine biosynthesis adenylyltransferase